MNANKSLSIQNFAQIADVNLEFGDLTVVVGAQGTGKSLALQWLKTAVDGAQIVSALREAGHAPADRHYLIDLIFGVGMMSAWRSGESRVTFDGHQIRPDRIARRGTAQERAFFIPAHRAMLISDGWPAPFQRLSSDVPVVARMFSQNLFDRFSARGGDTLFPLKRVLKKVYRDRIDDSVFHGGTVRLEESQHAKRLKLAHGDASLPFMTWTAGQREFTPLLLGLYHLLPPRNRVKQEYIEWVIIEEPEMGLHPQALTVFLLLVLDLLWRGYRVVLSTHSSHVLTAVWMLKRLQESKARWELVCSGFDVKPERGMQKVSEAALGKSYKVHLLEFGPDHRVRSKDISGLDPGSADAGEAEWGGLTGFSSRFGAAVRSAINESGT